MDDYNKMEELNRNIFIYKNKIFSELNKDQQKIANSYEEFFRNCGFNVVSTLKEANVALVLRQSPSYKENWLIDDILIENERREIKNQQKIDWFTEGRGIEQILKKYGCEQKKEEMRLNLSLNYKSVNDIKQTYIKELKEIN